VATQAVQAAQWLGIPTATFIFSWDNLTSQGRIMLPYDYYIVWNEALKKQLLEMYEWICPERVFVTGTPQFDFHFRPEFYQSRKDFCASVGADATRPLILYTTGMANHMPCEPELVEEIADLLPNIGEHPPHNMSLALHPFRPDHRTGLARFRDRAVLAVVVVDVDRRVRQRCLEAGDGTGDRGFLVVARKQDSDARLGRTRQIIPLGDGAPYRSGIAPPSSRISVW